MRMFCVLLSIASALQTAALASAASQSLLPTSELFFYETFDDVDPFSSGTWLKSLNEKYRDQPLFVKSLSTPLKGKLDIIMEQC